MRIFFSLLFGAIAVIHAQNVQAQSSCPQPVVLGDAPNYPPCVRPLGPVFACIDRNLNGTFTAHMGYNSENLLCCNGVPQSERILPIGNTHPFYRNYFTFSGPIPTQCSALGADGFNCGQPTVFPAGSVADAFTVTWDGAPLTWTLRTFSVFAPFFFEDSVTVSSAITPSCTQDLAPVCNAGSYSPLCSGVQTDIALNGSASFDPESFPLTYLWNVTCNDPQSTLENATSANATLHLFAPGVGASTSCTANLTVSDGVNSSNCSAPVNVPACSFDCTERDQRGDLIALDSSTLHQRNIVNTIAKRLTKVDRSRRARAIAKAAMLTAQKLYGDAWNSTWSLPSLSVVCTNVTVCTQTSTVPTIQAIQKSADSLLKLSNSLIARLRRVDTKAVINRYKKRSKSAHTKAVAETQQITQVQSFCP